jgi:tol-pal system protein YbgF
MRHILKAETYKLHVFCCAILLSSTVTAQGVGSVVESQPFTPGQSRPVNSSAPAASSDAMSLLLDQIRDLQREVQALRAMVEEQSFELRKMKRDSLSRYTNVDERLSDLESGAAVVASNNVASNRNMRSTTNDASMAAANNVPASNQRAASDNSLQKLNTATSRPSSIQNAGRGTLEPAVLSEQQLYQMAYDSVIKSDFELSIAEFDQYLSIYPEGRFVTNAHYWKGQAYLYLNRFTEAVLSYDVIINQKEESAKLPDAMYGLALAYEGMGNIPRAKQLLNDIKIKFPNTGVANLADTRLLSLD